jgi:hypothetical protein
MHRAVIAVAVVIACTVAGGQTAAAAPQFVHRSTEKARSIFLKGPVRVRPGFGARDLFGVIVGSSRSAAVQKLDLRCATGDEFGGGYVALGSDGGVVVSGSQVFVMVGRYLGDTVANPGTICAKAEATLDATHDTAVLFSPDLGKTWTALPQPPALPLVDLTSPGDKSTARLLLESPDGNGVLYGNPARGYSRFVPGSAAWVPAGMTGFMPGLVFRDSRYAYGDAGRVPKGYEVAGVRQVGVTAVWQWEAGQSGKAIFTLGSRTTKPRLRLRTARIGKSSCAPRTVTVADRFQQVSAGDTGEVLWAVSARKSPYRCGRKTRSLHVRARLLKSTNYGRSWHVVSGPAGVSGDELGIVDVDGSVPVLSGASPASRCKNQSDTRLWRASGKKWVDVGCQDIGTEE